MSVNQGCLTSTRRLLEGLTAAGASTDPEGRFLIVGPGPFAFLGSSALDNDVLVTGDSYYFVDGERRSLLTLARSHGQGSPVVAVY
jgi:hypothetical protein